MTAIKTGTKCTECVNASLCINYDPREQYGFCHGFVQKSCRYCGFWHYDRRINPTTELGECFCSDVVKGHCTEVNKAISVGKYANQGKKCKFWKVNNGSDTL